ncbi:acyltransferase [Vibrio cincinnatiensis]|uniref:acyltransferase n=1 Tax=Vibrio cincinnatiensis TaxID=675 RepID=UPI001EE11534|nr:acyltransferase [Vibrio cincinnatiensis]
MRHYFLLVYAWLVRLILAWLPDQKGVMQFRGFCYSLVMPSYPKNFQVASTTILRNLENLHVGNDVYIAPGAVVNAIDTIIIEDEVMIAFNSVITSGNHTMLEGSYRFGISNKLPILIKRGSWVAANCTVVAGAVIEEGCLIAANSLARGVCQKYGIYSGVPVKLLRKVKVMD